MPVEAPLVLGEVRPCGGRDDDGGLRYPAPRYRSRAMIDRCTSVAPS